MGSNNEWVLVTGGAGYIGSHVVVELLRCKKQVIIVDNYSNSSPCVIDRIRSLSDGELKVYRIDLLDAETLREVFRANKISAVIHLAGLKSVGQSVQDPVEYYSCNITGTCNLLQLMHIHKVQTLVHSSSATVYGTPSAVPITEDSSLNPSSPYGRSKLFIEHILKDTHAANKYPKQTVILRYFNPVGAHPSGLIGEDPKGRPSNLLPALAQCAIGRIPELEVFGGDYETEDGTGVRDYLHVMDLAAGHISALEYCARNLGRWEVFNLGTGTGYSVLEVLRAFEKVSGRKIKYTVCARRPGDVPVLLADSTKASVHLAFKCKYSLQDMCSDHWTFQHLNPRGYECSIPFSPSN